MTKSGGGSGLERRHRLLTESAFTVDSALHVRQPECSCFQIFLLWLLDLSEPFLHMLYSHPDPTSSSILSRSPKSPLNQQPH